MGILSYSKPDKPLWQWTVQISFHYHLLSVLQLLSCLSKFTSPLWTFPFTQDKIPACLDIHPGISRDQVKFTEQRPLSSWNATAIPTSPSTQSCHARNSFPASPLHCQEAGLSHRPSVRTLTMQTETPAVSSPPLSMTVAQGLQNQPELGHLPARDHVPSLFLSSTDPNEGSILSCLNPPWFWSPPLCSCHQSQVYQQTPSNHFSTWGSDTLYLFPGLLF